jgi:hypothetical protein
VEIIFNFLCGFLVERTMVWCDEIVKK